MSNVSLSIIQQAISHLFNYSPPSPSLSATTEQQAIDEAINRARTILDLPEPNTDIKVGLLKLIFDLVHLDNQQDNNHYVPLKEITSNPETYPSIPYPTKSIESLEHYRNLTRTENLINQLEANWDKVGFLTLVLEKYGACVSYGDEYVAMVDMVRIWAAIAEVLYKQPETQELCLIAGNLSGIQKFIYTISSDGALKSLRARSFYLEIFTEEVVQQLLQKLDLPRTNIVYASGGNLFLLAPPKNLESILKKLRCEINNWLDENLQGKVYLSLAHSSCAVDPADPANELDNEAFSKFFRKSWNQVIELVNNQKLQRYSDRTKELKEKLTPQNSYNPPCKVCHRDDQEEYKLQHLTEDPDSALACSTCFDMFKLGDVLPKVKTILRSSHPGISCDLRYLKLGRHYYYLYDRIDIEKADKNDTVYLINSWDINNYKKDAVLLLLGNYYQVGESGGFITAEELAQAAGKSKAIERVGYLRMDVDRLGQIFAKGLNDQEYSLPRIASLSRQMSYFFKVYLNSLASDRQQNFLKYQEEKEFQVLSESDRKNLMFIYAGGDDLFISGAWNEITEFALDIYQSFRAYSGNNTDITISGGISIEGAKFPLYQAARASGDAEDKAKANGRNSLGLFGQSFKWDEWFGSDCSKIMQSIKDRDGKDAYWEQEKNIPTLAGVFPFVKILIEEGFGSGYSRSFVRNLLKAAELQEQKLADLKLKNKRLDSDEARDLRYYLHLPQVAYTIARLPQEIKLSDDFRKSLKSPYNAPYFRAIATWIELLNRIN